MLEGHVLSLINTCCRVDLQILMHSGLCRRALIFRDLPSNDVLISDNSRVRKNYFLNIQQLNFQNADKMQLLQIQRFDMYDGTFLIYPCIMLFFPMRIPFAEAVLMRGNREIPYFFIYKTEFFSFQNTPKDLDPSCKMDLDLWNCLGRQNWYYCKIS